MSVLPFVSFLIAVGSVFWFPLSVGSVFIAMANLLDSTLPQSRKNLLLELILRTFPPHDDWYSAVHRGFRVVFDQLYGYDNSPLERLVWIGILGAYFVLFVARITIWAFGIEMPDTALLLTSAILVSTAAVLLVYGAFGSEEIVAVCTFIEERLRVTRSARTERALRITVASIGVGIGTATFVLLSMITALGIELMLGLAFLASFALPLAAVSIIPRSLYPVSPKPGKLQAVKCMLFVVFAMSLYVLAVNGAASRMGGGPLFIVALAAGSSVVSFFIYIPFKIQKRFHSINPLRAMLSSLLFVLLVGLVFRDAGSTFVDEIRTSGFIAVSFLAFNVFADSISLIETRWLLQKSKDFPVPLLVLSLLLDLVLSSTIYLVLPIFVGQEIHVFVEAIRFGGPSPWIGVLFWSTFSTSALFYLFVAAIAILQVVKPTTHVVKIFGKTVDLENRPTTFISVVIILLVYSLYGAYELSRFALG